MARTVMSRLAVAALLCVALPACTSSKDTAAADSIPDTLRVMQGGVREMSPYHKPDSTTGEVNLQETSVGGTNTPAQPGGKAAGRSTAAAAQDSAQRTRTKKP
jgi:hypothetical protein